MTNDADGVHVELSDSGSQDMNWPPAPKQNNKRLSRTTSFFGTQAVFKEKNVAAEEDIHYAEEGKKRPLLERLGIKNSKKYFPYFTIIINIILVIMMAVETGGNGGIESFSVNPWAGPSTETLVKLGAKDTPLIQDGEVWRLGTAVVLHAGWLHLLGNIIGGVPLGIWLERIHGPIRMFFIYTLSGIGGTLASAVFYPGAITVGASSAIFGLIGVIFIDTIGNWRKIVQPWLKMGVLIVTMAISIGLGLLPGVDNFAHIGGFLMGMICSALVIPDHLVLFGIREMEEEATDEQDRLERAQHAIENGDRILNSGNLTNAQMTDIKLRLERLRDAMPEMERAAERSAGNAKSYLKRARIMFGIALPLALIFFIVQLVLLFTVVSVGWCEPCELISCVGDWCDDFDAEQSDSS